MKISITVRAHSESVSPTSPQQLFVVEKILWPVLAAVVPLVSFAAPKALTVGAAIAAMALIVKIFYQRQWSSIRPPLDVLWWMGCFFIAGMVSGLSNGVAVSSFVRLGTILLFVLLGYGLHLTAKQFPQDVKERLLAILTGAIALGGLLMIGGSVLDSSWMNRGAVVLLVILPFLVPWVWRRRGFLSAIALLFIMGIGVFLSQSETAKLGFGAVIAMGVAVRYFPRFAYVLVIGFLGLSMMTMPWLVQVVSKVLNNFPLADWNPMTFRIRLEIWQAISDRIKDHWFLGYGLDGLKNIWVAYTTVDGQVMPISVTHPHNAPLQIWGEMGLLGAGLATILGVRILTAASRFQGVAYEGVLSGVFVAALMASVSHGAWQGWWLAALCFAAFTAGLLRPASYSVSSRV